MFFFLSFSGSEQFLTLKKNRDPTPCFETKLATHCLFFRQRARHFTTCKKGASFSGSGDSNYDTHCTQVAVHLPRMQSIKTEIYQQKQSDPIEAITEQQLRTSKHNGYKYRFGQIVVIWLLKHTNLHYKYHGCVAVFSHNFRDCEFAIFFSCHRLIHN